MAAICVRPGGTDADPGAPRNGQRQPGASLGDAPARALTRTPPSPHGRRPWPWRRHVPLLQPPPRSRPSRAPRAHAAGRRLPPPPLRPYHRRAPPPPPTLLPCLPCSPSRPPQRGCHPISSPPTRSPLVTTGRRGAATRRGRRPPPRHHRTAGRGRRRRRHERRTGRRGGGRGAQRRRQQQVTASTTLRPPPSTLHPPSSPPLHATANQTCQPCHPA